MRRPIAAFLRASSLHIGAAAATTALREELTRDYPVTPGDVDVAYAVSRITPGTNLLALYAQLGHKLGGWPLAVQAVTVGVGVPAVVAVLIAWLSERDTPWIASVMAGARAGGIAVFLGAAVRLLRPQVSAHQAPAVVLALVVVVVAWRFAVSPFVVLLAAGSVGAAVFRRS